MALLHEAFDKKLYCHVLLLLDRGFGVHSQDKDGRTILMKCCSLSDQKTAHIIAAKIFKRVLYDLDTVDKKGRNTLAHAVINNDIFICQRILSKSDLNLNIADDDGHTPLHFAAMHGHLVITVLIVSMLRRYSVSVDTRNSYGFTPLMLACKQGHLLVARCLVNEGKASLTMRDNIYFKNAKEWLETAFVIPPALDPFRPTLPIGIFEPRLTDKEKQVTFYDLQIGRQSSAAWQKPDIGSSSIRERNSSKVMNNLMSTSLPSFAIFHGQDNAFSSHIISDLVHSDNNSNIFTQLYSLYAAQSSKSYRPPSKPPVIPQKHDAPPHVVISSEDPDSHGRRSSTRTRIRRMMQMKKAESIIASLKHGARRKHSTSSRSSNNSGASSPTPLRRKKSATAMSEADNQGKLSNPTPERSPRKLSSRASSSSLVSDISGSTAFH